MKPYEVEIFDRQFNFRCNALVNSTDFTYKYDILSPEKNTINLPKDTETRITSTEGTVGDGSICTSDYVRITGNGREYTGVITKIEKNENYTVITYMDVLHLFDHEVYVKVDDVKFSSVEKYLYLILNQEFIATTDNTQKIYGLNISYTSETEGIFDYCYTPEVYTIINLFDDYISPAFKYFLIKVSTEIDISNKSINVTIGKIDENSVKAMEGDLPNVIKSNYVIRQSNDETNKLVLIDTYNNQYDKYSFYLHASDYSFNRTNNDRIAPVVNDIEEFDSSIITEEAYWSEVNQTLPNLQRYLQYSGTLTHAELDLLKDSFNEIYPYYKTYLESQLTDSWYKDKLDHEFAYENNKNNYCFYPIYSFPSYPWYADTFTAGYKDVGWYDDASLQTGEGPGYLPLFYTYRASSVTRSISQANLDFRQPLRGKRPDEVSSGSVSETGYYISEEDAPDEILVVISQAEEVFWWCKNGRYVTGVSKQPIGDDTYNVHYYTWSPYTHSNYSHLHIKLPYSVELKVNQKVGSGFSIEYYSGISGYINIPVTYSDITAAIDAYKQTAEYRESYNRYRIEKFNYLLDAYANKTFKTAKYTNNIELVVSPDDAMIKPLDMEIGQVVNIIHNGVAYNSILSGREILNNGLVKLIFGTIRLELTKILNMKGI